MQASFSKFINGTSIYEFIEKTFIIELSQNSPSHSFPWLIKIILCTVLTHSIVKAQVDRQALFDS